MLAAADFSQRTFLEHVSLAAREPVYSAAIAWTLSERSPLPLAQRLAIVEALSGAGTTDGREIKAITEWNHVDILLTVERESGPLHVAIENKIKAVEGSHQLANYDRDLDLLPGVIRKILLTLTGEAPHSSGDWIPVSYADLLDALVTRAASDSQLITDVCGALSRLVAVANASRDGEGGVATAAFGDRNSPCTSEITAYMREMRLEKIIQRLWMTDLAAKLDVSLPWQTSVGETHGQASMNVEAVLEGRPGYALGLQLQWNALKAFCSPVPYPRAATDEQHRTVEEVLESIRSALRLGKRIKPSPRRSRGFRSFTVTQMPSGRNHDEWIVSIAPTLMTMVREFQSVMPIICSHADG